MKFLEEVKKTGRIPSFDLKKELDDMLLKGMIDRPSARMLFYPRKKKLILNVLDDVQKNHNLSWYRELRNRAERDFDAVALFYRGRKITFREMFENADKFARSLKKSGINKGDEIPCCISNSPELIYTMLAASKVGAKLNLFGTHLDKEYLKMILSDTTNKIIIMTDDNYPLLKDNINDCNFEKKLVFSLADSLPEKPEICNEYVKELDKYYHYDNIAKELKIEDNSIILKDEFFKYGDDYKDEVEVSGKLTDDFLVTYTSGSTKRGRPKQIIHTNSSLIVSGTFNDMEISGSPKIPYQRGMCYIHSESNTNLVTCISDSLMKGWSVACEPEYARNKALDVIRLNNPSMIEMTTTHLVQMAKDYLDNYKKGIKYKFPSLIATFSVGEGVTPGEEKLLNKVLRLSRAGSGVTVKGIHVPFAPLSVGGGDCEHGGIFYNVFNAIQAKKDMLITKSKHNGMQPVVFSVVTALKPVEVGKFRECEYGEYGVLVANSATSFAGYKNNLEKTIAKVVSDEDGRDWISCDAYGFIDKAGKVHQKDRVGSEIILGNGYIILPSQIADCVSSDSKNILSCCVTAYHTENGDIPVINYELSPLMKSKKEKVLKSMSDRIKNKYGDILENNLLYREFSNDFKFPEAGSGKRDFGAIENMGLENTFRIDNNVIENNITINNENELDENIKVR